MAESQQPSNDLKPEKTSGDRRLAKTNLLARSSGLEFTVVSGVFTLLTPIVLAVWSATPSTLLFLVVASVMTGVNLSILLVQSFKARKRRSVEMIEEARLQLLRELSAVQMELSGYRREYDLLYHAIVHQTGALCEVKQEHLRAQRDGSDLPDLRKSVEWALHAYERTVRRLVSLHDPTTEYDLAVFMTTPRERSLDLIARASSAEWQRGPDHVSFPQGEGLAWHCFNSAEALYASDVQAQFKSFFKVRHEHDATQYRSMFLIPLYRRNKRVGVLTLATNRVGLLDPQKHGPIVEMIATSLSFLMTVHEELVISQKHAATAERKLASKQRKSEEG